MLHIMVFYAQPTWANQLGITNDLATPEECKAELTWLAWLHIKVLYQPKDGHPSQ